jgi:hypothetical protein
MDHSIDVYCLTCFAVPGEVCRTKFIVHGHDEVTPVICPTHNSRLLDAHDVSMAGRSWFVDSTIAFRNR